MDYVKEAAGKWDEVVDVNSSFWSSFFAGQLSSEFKHLLDSSVPSQSAQTTELQLRFTSRVNIRKLFRLLCNIRSKIIVILLSLMFCFVSDPINLSIIIRL